MFQRSRVPKNLIGKESVENTEMELEELLSAAWPAQAAQSRYQLHWTGDKPDEIHRKRTGKKETRDERETE